MPTGIGNEWDPGDPPEIHNEGVPTPEAVSEPEALPERPLSFFTRKQICDELDINPSTLTRWEQKGLITPSQRVNNICVYSYEQYLAIKKIWSESSRNMTPEQLCSACKTRKARANSTLCSRCSYTALERQLRSTLPGMVHEESAPSTNTGTDVSSSSDDFQEIECPTCHSDDPFERKMVTTGVEDFPITLLCSDDWHKRNLVERVAENMRTSLDPNVKYYTRRDVAEIIGVSPTTICRWEQKGAIPPPLKSIHSNQRFYTEEHIQKAKEFFTIIEQVKPSPLSQAAKGIGMKSFSRLTEKAVAIKLPQFRRGNLI